MKKILKTVLILLVVLIIVLGAVAYFNRNTISALLMVYTASDEELKEKLDSSGSIDNEVLSGYTDITLRDLTDEEKAKLANDEITKEDAVALVMGLLDPSLSQPESDAQIDETVTDVPEEQAPTTEAPSVEAPVEKPVENDVDEVVPEVKEEHDASTEPAVVPEKPVENKDTPAINDNAEAPAEISEERKQVNQKIAELVAELYVVRAKVISKFDAYIEELKTEYDADRTLTKEERKATKPQFAARAIKVVAKWEKECDTEMNAILSEVETLLKESGQSLELVDTIRKAYEDEKAAKKAYCINQYLD